MVPTYIPMGETLCGEYSAMQSYLSSENPSSAHTKNTSIWRGYCSGCLYPISKTLNNG